MIPRLPQEADGQRGVRDEAGLRRRDGEVTDPEAYRAATKRFSKDQIAHTVMCLIVAALGIVSGAV